jgi:hypothetical protein
MQSRAPGACNQQWQMEECIAMRPRLRVPADQWPSIIAWIVTAFGETVRAQAHIRPSSEMFAIDPYRSIDLLQTSHSRRYSTTLSARVRLEPCQWKPGRLLDWNVDGLGALQNPARKK